MVQSTVFPSLGEAHESQRTTEQPSRTRHSGLSLALSRERCGVAIECGLEGARSSDTATPEGLHHRLEAVAGVVLALGIESASVE